jgi:hypothetical protein
VAGSYGIGKILYQAQQNGLPEAVAADLESLTKGLVDRGDAPPFKRGRQPGVESRLLVGRPARGGFGLLPWREHCLARQAVAARRYMLFLVGGDASLAKEPLWVPLATRLLTRLSPSLHPAFALLSHGRTPGFFPMGPLRRMAEGIAALGEPIKISTAPPPPGPWRTHLPLWGNPLLQLERPASGTNQRTIKWVDSSEAEVLAAQQLGFNEWMDLPGLHTLGDLSRLLRILERETYRLSKSPPVPLDRRFPALLVAIYGPDPPSLPPSLHYLFQRWSPREIGGVEILMAVRGMFQAIPQSFRDSRLATGLLQKTRGPLDLGATAEAVAIVLGQLGWPGVALMDQIVPGTDGRSHYPMSVKSATNLQLSDAFTAQRAARTAYVSSALSVGGEGTEGVTGGQAFALRRFEKALGDLWRVPWDNVHKEPLWRLSVNGVRNAGGHELCPLHPCPCGFCGAPGTPSPRDNSFAWRLHHFWRCPVAVAVVGEIQRALPGVAVKCSHIWLLHPPNNTIHPGVWGVVAAAAIAAMHSGRKNLIRLHLRKEELVGSGQTVMTAFFPSLTGGQATPQTVLQRASRWATAWFWCLLQDFACLHSSIPSGWGAGPPTNHPFLAVDTSLPGAGRIIVRPV